MTNRIDVAVIGAGQAGLAVSRQLKQHAVEHVVLEKDRVAQSWRTRWDSFCLITPNWGVNLPGQPYAGDDPDGFMSRDEIASYLQSYGAGFGAPVREGVDVTRLTPGAAGGFTLDSSAGQIQAGAVVVCTGTYGRPSRPPGADAIAAGALQIDADSYRNPGELPTGPVLVVGSGQSGCQIAEELREAGREVLLSCGRAPWIPRRIGAVDSVWWAVETGFFDAPASSLPSPAARLIANVQLTGRDGGHDLHYRTLQAIGVTLLGHFAGADGHRALFTPDLGEIVAWGDERHGQLMGLIRKVASERGLAPPQIPTPPPFGADAPEEIDLHGFGAIVFASGYRPDYASWVRCPGAFDELGFPLQHEGASTVVPGLYFVGVHFQRKRQSSLLRGVGEDATIVADRIATTTS